MELKDYLKILGKHQAILWGMAIVVLATVLIYDAKKPIEYQGSLTFMVVNKAEKANEYKYDSYYNLQAAVSVAESLEAWFHSPDNVALIYNDAKISLPISDMNKLQNLFQTRRNNLNSSLLVVRLNGNSKEDVQKVLKKSAEIVPGKIKELQNKQVLASNFYLDIEGPTVLVQPKSYLFDAILGLIVGLILGGMISFAKEYLAKN